ncbi:phosphatidylinositol 3 and 4-kinase-domain-containing protein [Haematococcus lacustris]
MSSAAVAQRVVLGFDLGNAAQGAPPPGPSNRPSPSQASTQTLPETALFHGLASINVPTAHKGYEHSGIRLGSVQEHVGNRPRQLPTALSATCTPTSDKMAGWEGLLEISRTSGMSGVIGPARSSEDDAGQGVQVEICCTAHPGPAVRYLVKSVIRGLRACQEPEKALEGMGGTYFFANDNGRKVAILKPCDEEPLAPNNPKGYVGRSLGDPGWKPTVRVGEAAMREVAAYLLDHQGFARVPCSVLVRARHPVFCYNNRMSSVRQSTFDLTAAAGPCGGGDAESMSAAAQPSVASMARGGAGGLGVQPRGSLPMKLGSLQEFVAHECDTTEMGSSRFCVSDVHRIGILDIRLLNTDRHGGNMLVRSLARDGPNSSSANLRARSLTEPLYQLVPIDHGFCLPETLEAPYFEWLHWPQAQQPFSQEELDYIAALDCAADQELLRRELPNLRPECLRVLELATGFLQAGAAAGLSLYEIASLMTRPADGGAEQPSILERAALSARAQVLQEAAAGSDCSSAFGSECSSDVGSEDEELLGDASHLLYRSPCLAYPMSPRPLPASSSKEDDGALLFDLEDDGSQSGSRTRNNRLLSSSLPTGIWHSDPLSSPLLPATQPLPTLTTTSSTVFSPHARPHPGFPPPTASPTFSLELGDTPRADTRPNHTLLMRATSLATPPLPFPTTPDATCPQLDLHGGLTPTSSCLHFTHSISEADGTVTHTLTSTPAGEERVRGEDYTSRSLPRINVPAPGHREALMLTPVKPAAAMGVSPAAAEPMGAVDPGSGTCSWTDSHGFMPRGGLAGRRGGAGAEAAQWNASSSTTSLTQCSPSGAGGCNIATSVHVTDAHFLHRHMMARGAGRQRQKHHKRHGHKSRRARQAYPPPVIASALDGLNGLFSALDERQWARFMEVMHATIAAGLQDGSWRRAADRDAAIPASCPRF